MFRALAATVIIIGFLAVGLAASSYIHLQVLASAPPPVRFEEYYDLHIMLAGTSYIGNTKSFPAAEFVRTLQLRIFWVLGFGVLMMIVGGAMFIGRSHDEPPDPAAKRAD
jgi:hypothetical protein